MLQKFGTKKETNQLVGIKFDAKDVIEYDNQQNPYPVEKAHEFRDSLKREYEEYIDEKNKLNPEVITDPNILKRNILEELGVSEQILSKPGLLVELGQMVDYAAEGQRIQTSADVDRVLENLRKTTEITDNQVSGIKANRKYASYDNTAIDLTEGVKITALENNEYEVENTKYARAFEKTDEDYLRFMKEGEEFLDVRQESVRTRYREDYVDKTRLEKTKKEKMSYRGSLNIGHVIEAKDAQELNNKQHLYLAEHLPTQYSDLQTMLGNEEYEEIWRDSRSKQQQMEDDKKRAQEQQEQEQE